jgi:uncharacterized protein YbaP (TraB family)
MEDINPMALISQAAMEDTTLKDLLTEAEYKQVEKAVQEASGLPLAMMNKMKPIMVTQTLVMMEFQQALDRQLAQPSDGLDGYLQKVARKNDLSVKGLEKLDEQMDMMMNSLPLDQQADQLVQVVQNRDSLRREVLLLDSCYVHQSLSCLFAISQQSRTVDPNQMTKLVDDRNERWLEAMPAMMQAAPTFFAVGALHLPGEAGLVRQLRQRGYQLAPIPFGSD